MVVIRQFGRYQVIETLGRGSMSTVFKAKDPLLGRDVAVKVIHPHLMNASQEFSKRFEREVLTIARLNHPGIIEVFDTGRQEDTFYMVLKLVGGGTLKERLQALREKNQTMSMQEVISILTVVCDALEYIHNHGIVHRDLKPANIMFDEQNKPVLADFGIVKITGGESYTLTRGVIGTPLYMSPEQCRQQTVDRRSDIYSMGMILYEMTTGIHPFAAASLGKILLAQLHQQPPDPGEVHPGIPSSVSDVILKALDKEPGGRYQRAGELAHAFSAALSASPSVTEVDQVERSANLYSVASGARYKLTSSIDNRIGRSRPGEPVEVNLSAEQGCEYIHSLHATVRYSSSGWELEAWKGIRNPVFVNQREILPGSKAILLNGDQIDLSGLELIIEME